MSKKMGVAVTTIQGWKKRNVIPAARRNEVFAAAKENEIDLSDLLGDAPKIDAPKIEDKPVSKTEAEDESVETKPETEPKTTPEAGSEKDVAESVSVDVLNVDSAHKIEASKPKLTKAEEKPQPDGKACAVGGGKFKMCGGSWTGLILYAIGIIGLVAILWPKFVPPKVVERTPPPVEEPIEEEEKTSFLGAMIPEKLNTQIEELKVKADEAKVKIDKAVDVVEGIKADVVDDKEATMDERLNRLGTHMSGLMNTPELADFMGNIGEMRENITGELRLEQAMEELEALMQVAREESYSMSAPSMGQEPEVEVDEKRQNTIFVQMLEQSRDKSPSLGQTFEGVPADDLKAAAMLLGMSQFRSALNRDNEAFDSDLEVLMGLVGDDNPELKESLLRLSPEAKSGVLTPSGLSSEFKTIAGDAVVASLSGEDSNFQDRAKAKMNQIFQVEKNGELVTGTDTQATLNRAQNMLNNGKIENAILEVQGLDGDAAKAMAPWISKAEATLMAQKAKMVVDDMMNGSHDEGSEGKMIHDSESGLMILKPKSASGLPKASKSLQDANPFN